jgi:hypothetical protein
MNKAERWVNDTFKDNLECTDPMLNPIIRFNVAIDATHKMCEEKLGFNEVQNMGKRHLPPEYKRAIKNLFIHRPSC